ncbi:MAG: hypothetical protein ACYDCN_04655 [Bacteroidia bacterium]
MSEKNLPVIEVVSLVVHGDSLGLIKAIRKSKTDGDPLAGGDPITDVVLNASADALQIVYNGTQTKPATTLVKDVGTQFNKTNELYKERCAFLKGVANRAAIAAGDVNAGLAVVVRCGHKAKKVKATAVKEFTVTSTIAGQIDVTTVSGGLNTTYIRQYGFPSRKDIAPTATQMAELIIGRTVKVSINGFKDGVIVAMREARLLVPHKKKPTSGTIPNTQRMATPTVVTKAHTPLFTDGVEHYSFGPWKY